MHRASCCFAMVICEDGINFDVEIGTYKVLQVTFLENYSDNGTLYSLLISEHSCMVTKAICCVTKHYINKNSFKLTNLHTAVTFLLQ